MSLAAFSNVTNEPHRFQWILDGLDEGKHPEFDIRLMGNDFAVAIPTVGSLVVGWTLVVPSERFLNIASVGVDARLLIRNLVKSVSEKIISPEKNIFKFEHGPSSLRSLIGCGVDQAHLHIVPLDDGFLEFVFHQSEGLLWKQVDNTDPWSEIDPTKDYYLVSSESTSFVAYPEHKQSQYFRRLVAKYTNQPDQWDYKIHTGVVNVEHTRRLFGQ